MKLLSSQKRAFLCFVLTAAVCFWYTESIYIRGETAEICNGLKTDIDCLANEGCQYCSDTDFCVPSDAVCPTNCSALTVPEECSASVCTWCPTTRQCMVSTSTCPSCSGLTMEQCQAATSECTYCAGVGLCVPNNAECLADCSALTVPEECSTSVCTWCPTTRQCMASTSTCPSCSGLTMEQCQAATSECTYCNELEICVLGVSNQNRCHDCTTFTKEECIKSTSKCNYCSTLEYCMEIQVGKKCVESCPKLLGANCHLSKKCYWHGLSSFCLDASFTTNQLDICIRRSETECATGENPPCQWCSVVGICGLSGDSRFCPGYCLSIDNEAQCTITNTCQWVSGECRQISKNNTGMIIGIIIGCVAVVGIISFLAYWFVFRK